MDFEKVFKLKNWVKNNINIHNTQLPSSILGIIQNSTPENISDDFLTFALIVYSVKNNIHKSNFENEELKNKLSDKETSIYVFRLFFSFMLEKLRRLEVIFFEPFNIFSEEDLESISISISKKDKFIEEKLRGKTLSYKEFVNIVF